MEFIWGCMVLSFKVLLGSFFWACAFVGFGLTIGILAYSLSGDWKKKKQEKPKYEGQPIVIKGGKKDAK